MEFHMGMNVFKGAIIISFGFGKISRSNRG